MVSLPTSVGADIGRLLITCPDRPGIVAAVSRFLFEHGANIVQSDQYSTDPEAGTFFLRMVFHLPGFDAGSEALERDFQEVVAEAMGMSWQLRSAAVPKRLAIMVSREEHCLLDLLWRWRRDELRADVRLVISNHDVHRAGAEVERDELVMVGLHHPDDVHAVAGGIDDRGARDAVGIDVATRQIRQRHRRTHILLPDNAAVQSVQRINVV